MIIAPKVRGFICTTAHPIGCAAHVEQQIQKVKQTTPLSGPKNVLVIGSSTGYGLAARICASFMYAAKTIGVAFERPAVGKRTASAGWYNTAAFESQAKQAGVFAASINGDAFSDEIKQQTIDLIKKNEMKIDLIVYSLASPKRTDPKTGETFSSCLKTIDKVFNSKSIDPINAQVIEASIEPANQQEIDDTVKVMGGEDWQLWIDALQQANVLADGVKTLALSYIGPEMTFPIYRDGSIGQAKAHLAQTAKQLDEQMSSLSGQAFISVNKAVVTQASSAIPVVPLYISLLFKVMKEKNLHEDCIEQFQRLYKDFLYTADGKVPTDENRRIRLDDLEMRDDVQQAVSKLWEQVTQDSLNEISDLAGYQQSFYQLFGFGLAGVDYQQDVDADVQIPSIA